MRRDATLFTLDRTALTCHSERQARERAFWPTPEVWGSNSPDRSAQRPTVRVYAYGREMEWGYVVYSPETKMKLSLAFSASWKIKRLDRNLFVLVLVVIAI